jgi:hypothetical protein
MQFFRLGACSAIVSITASPKLPTHQSAPRSRTRAYKKQDIVLAGGAGTGRVRARDDVSMYLDAVNSARMRVVGAFHVNRRWEKWRSRAGALASGRQVKSGSPSSARLTFPDVPGICSDRDRSTREGDDGARPS